MVRFFLILFLALALPGIAHADFDSADASHRKGDFAAALAALRPLAESGDARAQSLLGYMYARGEGVAKDYAEANRLFKLAADQGDSDGLFGLGLSHLAGNGVPMDEAKAVGLLRMAAEKGHRTSPFFLAYCLIEGRGTPVDIYNGMNWLNEARRRGDDEAVKWLLDIRTKSKLPVQARYEGGFGEELDDAIDVRGVDNGLIGVRAEYIYIDLIYPGWKPMQQSLIPGTGKHAGKFFDLIEIADREGKAKRSLYFDITPWFGKMGGPKN